MDLALSIGESVANPVDGDLRVDESGQLTLVTDGDAVAQHLAVRLRFFLGEWFLDQREGVPFFRDVFVKNPSRRLLLSVFRDVVVRTPGVSDLRSLELEIDSARAARLSFEAVLNTGEVLSYSPFVVEVG